MQGSGDAVNLTERKSMLRAECGELSLIAVSISAEPLYTKSPAARR